MKQNQKLPLARGRRRAFTIAATAALTAGLFFAGGLAPASAAGLGTGYDGTDPAGTGCSADATTIASKNLGNVIVDIRYSPSCQTNWVRVTTQQTDVMTQKTIGRDASGGLPAYTTPWAQDTGSSYSMQVFAPGATCVTANVNVYWGESSRYFIQNWTVC